MRELEEVYISTLITHKQLITNLFKKVGQLNNLYTADFSTLFKSLPHNDITGKLNFLTDLSLVNAEWQPLATAFQKCLITNVINSADKFYTKDEAKCMLQIAEDET